jgi:tetratricopeptide (TPR) repeat protein
LRVDKFLAVVGDSGSGKSSLVRAGLIPALQRGRFHDGKSWVGAWRIAVVRPGDRPFSELAEGLPHLARGMSDTERLSFVAEAKRLISESGGDGLRSAISALVPEKACVLLIVDQFEELFTLNRNANERIRFIDSLLDAAGAAGARPVHVIITLRADFYSHCFQHRELPKRIARNQFPVRRMGRAQMREVVEKPLLLVGAEAEPGLVDSLLNDVGDEPGNLPLLEHALFQLWERRQGRTLTHQAYIEIGRLSGALRNYAEQVYENRLQGATDRELARRILLRLTELGEGAQDTRRRERKVDLLALGDGEESAARVLAVLSDARLISIGGHVSGETEAKDESVEVAHEALIREWPRLRSWVNEDRECLRLERWVLQASEEWEAQGRDPSLLLRARLPEVEQWARDEARHLPRRASEFVKASIAARKKERRRKRLFSLAVGLLALGALTAALWGYANRREADLSYRNFELADQVVRQMLTIVDSEVMEEVPQVGELRAELLKKASLVYKEFQEGKSRDPRLRLQNALATRRLADIYRQLKENQEAEKAYLAAIARLNQLVQEYPGDPHYPQELANGHNWLGELLRDYNPQGALEAYNQALEIQERLVEKLPHDREYQREWARTSNNRGIVLSALGRFEPARSDFERAIQRYETLRADDRPPAVVRSDFLQELAWSYNNLGKLLAGEGKREDARSSYRHAIALGEELTAREPDRRQYRRELATYYNNLANLHYRTGDSATARGLSRKALDLLEELAAPAPLLRGELANAYNTLGGILDSLELRAEAEEAFAKALTLFESLEREYEDFSKEAVLKERFGNSLLGRGKLYFDKGRFLEASRFFCRAVSYHRDRNLLDVDFWYLAKSLESAHQVEAAALARELSRDLPDDLNPLKVAAAMAHCLTLMPAEPSSPPRQCQVRALELLQEGADKGTLSLERLESPEFHGLRNVDGFQGLLARLRSRPRNS